MGRKGEGKKRKRMKKCREKGIEESIKEGRRRRSAEKEWKEECGYEEKEWTKKKKKKYDGKGIEEDQRGRKNVDTKKKEWTKKK